MPADGPLGGHGDDQHPGTQEVGKEKEEKGRDDGGREGREGRHCHDLYIQVRKGQKKGKEQWRGTKRR